MGSFRRLLGYMRPYLAQMVLATLFLTLAGALMSLVVATAKPLVNEVLFAAPDTATEVTSSDSELVQSIVDRLHLERVYDWMRARAFIQVPLIFVVVFFIRGVLLYFGQYLTTKVGASVIRDLRAELYAVLVHQSLSFYHQNPTGMVLSRVLNDVQRIQRVSTAVLADLLRVGAMAPCMLLVALLHDWRMTVYSLVIIPFFAYPMVRLGRRLRKASKRAQETTADAANILNETVVGIKVVQGFTMESVGISRFGTAISQVLRADLQGGRAAALAGPIMEIVGAAAGASLFYVAGMNISRGQLDPGDFFVVIGGLTFLFMSIRRLNRVNVEIQQALAAAVRIFEMMDAERDIRERPEADELPPFTDRIHFDHISFAYAEGNTVLHDLDIIISKGETVALVGSSGAGKSTLANLVPRFLDPSAGKVTIDGHDLRGLTLRSLRAQIGLVTQETVLFDESVRSNITCARDDVPMQKVIDAARAAHAHGFIESLPEGYDTRLGEGGSRLSLGQRQRIAVARALLKDPPILILDEATSALDAESEDLVQRALSTLLEGRSSLVIAHRLSTVRQADRILVLDGGKVVEEGNHEILLARGGVYAHLHELQFRDAETSSS